LPSRRLIVDINDWIISKKSILDQLEKQMSETNLLDQKKMNYFKREFETIKNEMKNEREPQLIFVLDSIEKEIKEGFFDLILSEKCNKLQADWTHLKQNLNISIDLVEYCGDEVGRFEQNILQIKKFIDYQLNINEYTQINDESIIIFTDNSNINNTLLFNSRLQLNNTEKNVLTQISENKQRIQTIKENISFDENKIKFRKLRENLRNLSLVILSELESNLDRIELKNRLKLENNFTQLKQNYTKKINELYISLENEYNFLTQGKVLSHAQFQKSVQYLKEILNEIEENKLKMKEILTRFEEDLNDSNQMSNSRPSSSGGTQIKRVLSLVKDEIGKYDLNGLLLDDQNLKQSLMTNLTNKNLESKIRDFLKESETETNELFIKYDKLRENLLLRLEKTRANILHDLENLNSFVEEVGTSLAKANLFDDNLKEMLENKQIFQEYEKIDVKLSLKFNENELMKSEFSQFKHFIQGKFNELSNLSEKLSHEVESACREQQYYDNLVDLIQLSLEKAKRLTNTNGENLKLLEKNGLKLYLSDLQICEQELDDSLKKLKNISHVKSTKKIQEICNLTTKCTEFKSLLKENRSNLTKLVIEQNNSFENELNSIESNIKNYLNQVYLDFDDEQKPENILNDLIISFKIMQSTDLDLSKYEIRLEHLTSNSDFLNKNLERNLELIDRLKLLKDKIKSLRKEIRYFMNKNGLYEEIVKLKDLNNFLIANSVIDLSKREQFLQKRTEFYTIKRNLEKQIKNSDLENVNLNFNMNKFSRYCLDKIELNLNKLSNDYNRLIDQLNSYINLMSKIEYCLNESEEKFNETLRQNSESSSSSLLKLDYLKEIKQHILNPRFKNDYDTLLELGTILENTKAIGIFNDKASYSSLFKDENNFKHKRVQVKYLDFLCSLDQATKHIEFELSNEKEMVSKANRLLEILKHSHKLLAEVTLNKSKTKLEQSVTNFEESTLMLNDENCIYNASTNTLNDAANFAFSSLYFDPIQVAEKNEFNASSKTINQLTDFVKHDIIEKLNENEPIIRDLKDFLSGEKQNSSLSKEMVEKILYEWSFVNEKCVKKFKKLENFKQKISDLDAKLKQVRSMIIKNETYLDNESFKGIDLTNYTHILNIKRELENLADLLKKKDSEIESLFKYCLSANKNYLHSNKLNQTVIMNLKTRWSNLKCTIDEKLSKLNSIWTLLCDINDQIENFLLVLNKTESFYKNILLSEKKTTLNYNENNSQNNQHNILKLIEDLYFTIKDDYKLIKYLNESYVKFTKFVANLDCFESLEPIKKKLLSINSKWDGLHNEIAIKINLVRLLKFFCQFIWVSSFYFVGRYFFYFKTRFSSFQFVSLSSLV
jgi:hypothetical protein